MAWDEVIAALLGGLEGGVGGWQVSRKMQREQDQQKKRDAQEAEAAAARAEERDWRRADRERMTQDRARTEADQLLTSLGRDTLLTDDQAQQVTGAGLRHRVRPEETLTSSFFTGYSGTAGDDLAGGEIAREASPGRPTGRMFVAPTVAERKADQVADERRRAAEAERKAILDAINVLPQGATQDAARFGLASGKLPTLGTADFVSPEERTKQEVARVTAIEKAKFPLAIRQREAEKAIDRKYATMPAPMRDDPSMPQGVRSYLGDLVSRYQADPAAARAELQRAAPNLLRDHPNLDLVKVTQQMNAMLPLPQLTDEEKDAAAKERMAAAAAKQAPGSSASIPAPAPARPRPAPTDLRPGGKATLRNGQVVTITRVYPDGTFDYQ